MDRILECVGWFLAKVLRALPLAGVARLGRIGGAVAWHLDPRHRGVALANLEAALGSELSPARRRQIARENFRRLGENYACAVKTSTLDAASLAACCDFEGIGSLVGGMCPGRPGAVVAIGHFGNFEIVARIAGLVPGLQAATTYRALRQAGFNRVLQHLREASGCRYFERRLEVTELRQALRRGGLLLGLLSDQHARASAVRIPFFGRSCSTTTAPALLALRYELPLFTAVCFRTALGRWRVEVGPEIPTRDVSGRRRKAAELMVDVNAAFETAVRRDPANWFWVHQRWKPEQGGGRMPALEGLGTR